MKRQRWNTELGFLLAAVGSAVGLGNIWRFSYLAYTHGGGAFLLPYCIALLTIGIPLLILEFGAGHEREGSAPLVFAKISRDWEWLGWWTVMIVMFGIMLYYSTIISWCANYLVLSFDLGWGNDPDHFFFKQFLKVSDSPVDLQSLQTPILIGLAVVWCLCWLIVSRGVQHGIELANKVLMPLLLVLTIILVVWATRLDGAMTGIMAYIDPDFSKMTNPQVWIDAYSQIFFTLSLGFGIMIAYASYLPEETNLTHAALVTVALNSGYSILAGFGVFAILGFMAESEGKAIADVVTQSIGLAFVVYPKALNLFPAGNYFGVIFFFCLVIAGLSSAVSIIEAFTAAISDKFGLNRQRMVFVLCSFGFLGSLIFATNAGLHWLDIVDHYITHYGLVTIGFLECILVAWIFNLDQLQAHINKISSIKLGKDWNIMVRFVAPAALFIILGYDLFNEFAEPYGGYTRAELGLIGILWVLLTLISGFILAMMPWKTALLKQPGRNQG
ncbi:MAG: sodium-dependent transporter [Gammaproteobacteria bacterium]|nr:sodium-dependent transporter [Gammaproteobacteria bacterium]